MDRHGSSPGRGGGVASVSSLNYMAGDLISGINDWRNIQDVVRTSIKSLYDMAKAQGAAIARLEAQMREKATRDEVEEGLARKANVTDVSHAMDSLRSTLDSQLPKAEVKAEMAKKMDAAEVRALLSQKASIEDVNAVLDAKVEVADFEAKLKSVAENFQILRDEIADKVHVDDLPEVLAGKADVEYVKAELDRKADSDIVDKSLRWKANSDAVQKALHKKASKEEVARQLDAQLRSVVEELKPKSPPLTLDDVKEVVRRSVSAVEERMESVIEEVEERTAGDVQKKMRREIDQLEAAIREVEEVVKEGVATKVSVDELDKAVTVSTESIKHAIGREIESLRSDFRRLQEDARSAGDRETHSIRQEVHAALTKKADASEVRAALMDKADVEEVKRWLDHRADARVLESVEKQKVDRVEMLEYLGNYAKMDAIDNLASSQKRLISVVERVENTVEDVVKDTRELKVATSSRPSIDKVEKMVEAKAGVEEVNRVLSEAHTEIEKRAFKSELERIVSEQAIINASLCAEMSVGRWIWKTGKTKAGRHVPWNVQSVNTNAENYLWERDATTIITVAPGLYEVTFGFYANRKPTVQLLINKEPVLSAVNSSSYVLHHSSGRLMSHAKHSAGNVTGLTLIDFVALPAKARISLTYEGVDGAEGFLGLKKM
mmetsp:Transcript_10195/g.26723  ORF Transcript_10195/g.26723 Transcript_10195/m.26723 type:complete len:664 (-) Transcript_10195:135-2126(-)